MDLDVLTKILLVVFLAMFVFSAAKFYQLNSYLIEKENEEVMDVVKTHMQWLIYGQTFGPKNKKGFEITPKVDKELINAKNKPPGLECLVNPFFNPTDHQVDCDQKKYDPFKEFKDNNKMYFNNAKTSWFGSVNNGGNNWGWHLHGNF